MFDSLQNFSENYLLRVDLCKSRGKRHFKIKLKSNDFCGEILPILVIASVILFGSSWSKL